MNFPKITIITPNYNQGQFLEICIKSVLNQDYPDLEYIIIDGGSTDLSLEIIRRYQDRLAWWVSEKDNGQSHAINKGITRATGVIFNWINADDFLEPDAFRRIAEAYMDAPDACGWVGACRLVEPDGSTRLTVFPNGLNLDHLGNNWNGRVFYQPGCFLSTEAVREVGMLREDLHFCMDYELYVRLLQSGWFAAGKGTWTGALIHPETKTQHQLDDTYREVIQEQKRYGFNEGAENLFARRFGDGKLEYVPPDSVRSSLIETGGEDALYRTASFRRRRHLAFIGDLQNERNRNDLFHFLKTVFPLILTRNPRLQLYMLTPEPSLFVGADNEYVKFISIDNIDHRVLDSFKALVLPALDTQSKHDVFLLAAEAGLPVVSTPVGISGLPVKHGEHFFIAENDREFAAMTHHLINDPPTWGGFSARLQLFAAELNKSNMLVDELSLSVPSSDFAR